MSHACRLAGSVAPPGGAAAASPPPLPLPPELLPGSGGMPLRASTAPSSVPESSLSLWCITWDITASRSRSLEV
jgi:hypothetical protein